MDGQHCTIHTRSSTCSCAYFPVCMLLRQASGGEKARIQTLELHLVPFYLAWRLAEFTPSITCSVQDSSNSTLQPAQNAAWTTCQMALGFCLCVLTSCLCLRFRFSFVGQRQSGHQHQPLYMFGSLGHNTLGWLIGTGTCLRQRQR